MTMTANVREHQVLGDAGITLHAVSAGPSSGPPVLLAHGAGQTSYAWMHTLSRLAATGFNATAIDLRGHGASGRPAAPAYLVDDFARDMLAIARNSPRAPHLIGASLGGLAGLIAEGMIQPGAFASLTLVDIAPQMEASGVEKVLGFMAADRVHGFASPQEAADRIAQYLPGRARTGRSGGLARYLKEGLDGRFHWHWDARILDVMSASAGGASAAQRFEKAARALTLPVHLVRGGASDLITSAAASEFCALVPQAQFTQIEDAGHMVAGDRNDAFAAVLIDWLVTL